MKEFTLTLIECTKYSRDDKSWFVLKYVIENEPYCKPIVFIHHNCDPLYQMLDDAVNTGDAINAISEQFGKIENCCFVEVNLKDMFGTVFVDNEGNKIVSANVLCMLYKDSIPVLDACGDPKIDKDGNPIFIKTNRTLGYVKGWSPEEGVRRAIQNLTPIQKAVRYK